MPEETLRHAIDAALERLPAQALQALHMHLYLEMSWPRVAKLVKERGPDTLGRLAWRQFAQGVREALDTSSYRVSADALERPLQAYMPAASARDIDFVTADTDLIQDSWRDLPINPWITPAGARKGGARVSSRRQSGDRGHEQMTDVTIAAFPAPDHLATDSVDSARHVLKFLMAADQVEHPRALRVAHLLLIFGADQSAADARIANVIPLEKLIGLRKEREEYLARLKAWLRRHSASTDFTLLGWKGLGYPDTPPPRAASARGTR